MELNDNQKTVLAWVKAGKKYDNGVALYLTFGKNKSLARQFPGRGRRYARKLFYELCKSVGLDWKKLPKLPAKSKDEKGSKTTGTNSKGAQNDDPKTVAPVVDSKQAPQVSPVPDNLDLYPVEIRRLINEYSDLYKSRALLHQQMAEVPDNNEPKSVDARKAFSEEMETISARMDVLHIAREAYDKNKKFPDVYELWPEDKEKQDKDPGKQDTGDIDLEALKKEKKNLQTSSTRDRNLLLYQAKTKQKAENPMPDGPKRVTVEKRLEGKVLRIKEIDELIANAG
jgi:hypothetical protein